MHGPDGLGGIDLPRVQLHGGHPSDKVIWECLRAHPREITILALGPLTNISRVFKRDPGAAETVWAVHAVGPCRADAVVHRDPQPRQPGRVEKAHDRLQIDRGLLGIDVAADGGHGHDVETGIEQGHRQRDGVVDAWIDVDDELAGYGGKRHCRWVSERERNWCRL